MGRRRNHYNRFGRYTGYSEDAPDSGAMILVLFLMIILILGGC